MKNIDTSQSGKITYTPGAVYVSEGGKFYLAVFTDGSACNTASEWLHYGGWGVFTAQSSPNNVHGHLIGHPTTSYRAEVRALLEAVARTGTDVCIICDNQAAAQQLQKILASKGAVTTWRADDECSDYWAQIAQLVADSEHAIIAK